MVTSVSEWDEFVPENKAGTDKGQTGLSARAAPVEKGRIDVVRLT
jgi:hypothetical protein